MESWKVMESHGKNLSGKNGHGKSWNFALKIFLRNFIEIPIISKKLTKFFPKLFHNFPNFFQNFPFFPYFFLQIFNFFHLSSFFLTFSNFFPDFREPFPEFDSLYSKITLYLQSFHNFLVFLH